MRLTLIGYGVVGQSLTELLQRKRRSIVEHYGLDLKVVAIADSKGALVDLGGVNLSKALKVKREKGTVSADPHHGKPDFSSLDLIREVDSDVMIEVTPTNVDGGEPCLSHIKEALRNKRHVVTTNKSISLALPALLELANYNGVHLKFSGTVGAGMPILELGEHLAGDRVTSIKGILNGTTNYILTRMEEGLNFNEALREAQRLGYAEADPSMDVDGVDTACKLTILSNWIMGKRITLTDVRVNGIRSVTLKDVKRAVREGFSIKLLGQVNGDALVAPSKVSRRDPLNVSGVLNAVTLSLEAAGDVTITGKGAGGPETASSILRDLVAIWSRL